MLPHSERYPGSGTDTHIAEGIGRSGGNPDLQGRNGPAGEFGLDVHTNYVISGDRPVDEVTALIVRAIEGVGA